MARSCYLFAMEFLFGDVMEFIWNTELPKDLSDEDKSRFSDQMSLTIKRMFDFANEHDVQTVFVGNFMMGFCKMVAEFDKEVRDRIMALAVKKVEEEAQTLRDRIAYEASMRG